MKNRLPIHGRVNTPFIFFVLIILFVSCTSGPGRESTDSPADTPVSIQTPPEIKQPECETPSDEPAAKSIASTMGNSLWEAFRNRFPYHTQIIGISAIQRDKSCVILLSEPSPDVTQDGINNLVACFSHKLSVKQHQIGYDGWVKDVLIVLADIGLSDLEDLKEKLNEYEFKTNYGQYILPLQSKYNTHYSADVTKNSNYQIAPNELQSWFCGNEALGFNEGIIFDLLANTTNGISSLHYSKNRGFVAWILPQGMDISNEKETIRRFALDADLIIGAIAKNNNLAIIGRERQTSVFELPPLRTETILQLAAANDKELAQSYERNNIMACKLENGNDWAPIFLSDELLNTEYGSLLDITDQLLKSWSQNGETSYAHFSYQHPRKWGFEKALGTLMYEKFNSSSLTFNWNTSGAAYQFDNETDMVVGLNRIGSLPVSYIPDEQSSAKNDTYKNVEPYEKKGYNFFSNSNDANLIRAAQYAAIYQIFKAYKITSPAILTTKFNTFKILEEKAEIFIDKIARLNEEQISDLVNVAVDQSIKIELSEKYGVASKSQVNSFMEEITSNGAMQRDIEEKKQALNNLRTNCLVLKGSPGMENMVIKMLVNRNGINSLDENLVSDAALTLYKEMSASVGKAGFLKWEFDKLGIDADNLVSDFVKYNDNSPSQWIKTPSVVVSRNKDLLGSYGGHNIDASLLKVELDNSVERGKIRIEDGVIKIHPEDQARMNPDLLRKLGVEVKNGELNGAMEMPEFSFNGAPPKPPRDIHNVFENAGIPPDKRGFVMGVQDVLEVRRVGNRYLVNGKKITSCDELQHVLFAYSSKNKKSAIEFIGFSQNAVEVRLKGAELELQTEAGFSGRFRKMDFDETMLLPNTHESEIINRTVYTFEKEPETGLSPKGNDVIGVELKATNNSREVFFYAESKTKNFFGKIKEGFIRAFNFSQGNDVDFVRKTYSELLKTGLQKNDFALILSNTKDCVLCRANPKDRLNFYWASNKKPSRKWSR